LAAWLVGSADHVFDGAATNERIYGTVVRELVGAIGGGFNGTAFTYGQTSCGKTFTMNGSDADPGIIRRACDGTSQVIRPTYSCPCPTDIRQPCRCP
jgi:centromeric protein E